MINWLKDSIKIIVFLGLTVGCIFIFLRLSGIEVYQDNDERTHIVLPAPRVE